MPDAPSSSVMSDQNDIVTGVASVENLRIQQARQLRDSVKVSCLIVSGVIVYITALFLFHEAFLMAAAWTVATGLMVLATYIYSISRVEITTENYRGYLRGHIVMSCLTGLVWSSFAVYQLDPASDLSIYIAMSIPTTITVGGMFPSSAYRATYIGLLTCCVLPMAIYWLIVVPFPAKLMTIALGLFYLFGLIVSARTEINMRDVLLARQANEISDQLKQQNLLIEEANREKTRFMEATVHDFSQPLHAQGYFIHALRSKLNNEEQIQLLNRIESSWRSQGELIRGIGDITRLDGGMIQPENYLSDIAGLVESVVEEFRSSAHAKGLRLEAQLSSYWAMTDPTLFSRIVRNLLGNAIKFTDAGGAVFVSVTSEQDQVVVKVADSGLGIAPEDQQRIFDEYVQLDDVHHDRDKGLGLGLSIVHRLTQLLNVAIKLNSELGQGTVFTLTLEKANSSERESRHNQISSQPFDHVLQILLVDDEIDILESMCTLMSNWGCQVETASSGAEAVSALADFEHLPSLLIVDHRLADSENGLDVIDRLRDEVNESLSAILMTGDVHELPDVRDTENLVLMTKPVKPADIQAQIRGMMNERA